MNQQTSKNILKTTSQHPNKLKQDLNTILEAIQKEVDSDFQGDWTNINSIYTQLSAFRSTVEIMTEAAKGILREKVELGG